MGVYMNLSLPFFLSPIVTIGISIAVVRVLPNALSLFRLEKYVSDNAVSIVDGVIISYAIIFGVIMPIGRIVSLGL
jgi:hypothetical protein